MSDPDPTSATNPGETGLDLIDEARQLLRAGDAAGIDVRLIGGIAIAMRCPTALEPPFARSYSDLDAMIPSRQRDRIDAVAATIGLEGDRSFNAQWGKERRCYHRADGLKLDVFVEAFTMCHEIPMGGERISADPHTVPLAELVLTKAQIVELTDKDAGDLFVIFYDHDLSADDSGINAGRIAELCASDWGLWRTVTKTLHQLEEAVGHIDTAESHRNLVRGRVERLIAAIEAAPKSRKWKMRSRVGERVQWYTLPEEPNEAVDLRAL